MSAPHEGECNGTDCAGWECGICECCTFDFGTPERLNEHRRLRPCREEEILRLCDLCMGTFQTEPSDELRFIGYVGNAAITRLDEIIALLKAREEQRDE